MSFYSMARGLTGEISGVALSLAQNKVQEALGKIYDQWEWSFTKGYSEWLVPGQLGGTVSDAGTYTVTPYSDIVIADATATAVLAAYVGPPLITQYQFRNPSRRLYNIIALDTTTYAPFYALQLDSPWKEPTSGPGQPYMIYQAYYVAPVQDFRKFIEISDTTNIQSLDFWSMSQADLARVDPPRTRFGYGSPTFVVDYGMDQRPDSGTLGYQLFEIWPHQISAIPYNFAYRRRGPMLVEQTDTVPYPITEELVTFRAKEILYQFKEANKETGIARGAGANWLMLAQTAKAEYDEIFDKLIQVDLNLQNDQQTHVRRDQYSGEAYANRLGQVNLGGYRSGY